MATTIVPDSGLAAFAVAQAISSPRSLLYFKIGEGGWTNPGTGRTPKDPDPTLTDLDCIENAPEYPVDSRFFYQKALTPGDITRTDNEVEVFCQILPGEVMDDGNGNRPEFWEIGLFNEEDEMIMYRTFDLQVADDVRFIRHVFTLSFERPGA